MAGKEETKDEELELIIEEEEQTKEINVEEGEQPVDFAEIEGLEPEKPVAKKNHEPGKDTPRFKQVYGKLKEAERTIEDLREHGSDNDPIVQQLVADNKKLLTAMRENTAAVKDTAVAPEDTSKSEISAIQDKITSKKADRKEARAAYDNDKADDLTDEINSLHRDIDKINTKPKADAPTTVDHEGNDAVEEFIAASPWYDPKNENFDNIMASSAEALDATLRQDTSWQGRPVSERLAEVQYQIEKRFTWYMEGEAPDWLEEEDKNMSEDKGDGGKKPIRKAAVEGGGGGKPPAGKQGTVTLSAEQVRVANMMDIPLEQYAKQFANIEDGKGRGGFE